VVEQLQTTHTCTHTHTTHTHTHTRTQNVYYNPTHTLPKVNYGP